MIAMLDESNGNADIRRMADSELRQRNRMAAYFQPQREAQFGG